MKYRIGIIGCGRIGCGFDDNPKRGYIATHAGAYATVPQTELVAMADLDPEKLDRYGRKYCVRALYLSYKEMLRREQLDIISICTWNSTNHQIVRDAVQAGVRAIWCEKPMADTLPHADEIIRTCEDHRVILQVNHQRRFDRLHQDVRRYVREGNLGFVQQVSVYYTAGIANTGSHVLDLLRFFFGNVNWVQAIFSDIPSPNPNDPNIDGMVKFYNGPLCTLQACDVSKYLIFEVDILGEKGRLRLTHGGFDVEFYQVKESSLFAGYEELSSAAVPFPLPPSREFMVEGVRHLLECLEGSCEGLSGGQDGRAALELICAFHESAQAGGKQIVLPLKESDIVIHSR